MVVVPPPAPVALTDLLAGYGSALQVADRLPPVLTVRAGDGRFTRRMRVPRLRLFLRSFSLLFIPAIINGVWSIVDPERRGLQDRAAGTRVVRAARRQQ